MSPAGDRDWADLPPELLGSIVKRLTVEDYIRFNAVCNSWASASSPEDGLFLPLAPQMPRLLLLGDGEGSGEFCTLVSLPDRRRRRIGPIPETRGKWCLGAQDGWLALLDERSEVSLLHLLTRAQIHLPSVATMPDVNPVYNSDGSLSEYRYKLDIRRDLDSYTLPEFRLISFKKVVWSSKPTSRTFTAMAIFSGYNVAAFATDGGGKWTLLGDGPPFTDIIYCGGKFLAVSYNGELWAIDVAGPSPEMTLIAVGWGVECTGRDKYLVESSGDLLMVWRGSAHDSFETKTIEVMKFDSEHASWVPLKSLGYNSLFMGYCYSVSLSARETSELKPNCIYFSEVLWDWLTEDNVDKLMTRDVWVFSLEDGSFDRYEPPDPRLNWPPPIWIAPSLL